MSNHRHIYWVIALALLSAVALCSYQAAHASEKMVGHNPAIQETPSTAEANTAADLWDDECSFCHGRKQLDGKTADDIRRAVNEVEVMENYKTELSDEDIESLGILLSGKPRVEKYKYITPEACQTCHPNHVRQWRHSLHAQAHFEPVYDRYFIKASMDSNQKLETFCAGCHTPIAVLNGSIPFPHKVKGPGDTKVSAVENDGVQCDFCHVIDGVKSLENGGYTVKASRTKFGPYNDSVSTFHDTAFSALHKSSDLCATCHNVTHPVNGIVLEATYTEWKESPYAKEGITCQDCHMTGGLVKKETHPGVAAKGGPDREHVSEHFFVGPNLIYANVPGAEEIKKLSERLLQSAGKVEIGIPEITDNGITVPVMVTNTGAGHYLPTGVTELRQMWLEIRVSDAAGHELFHSGGLDERGDIAGDAIVYFTDVIDETGASTTQFWNTVKKVSDRRIPPRQTVTEMIRIPVVKGVGPLAIEVALQYRSVSPRGLAEVGAPRDLVDIPVVTISRSSRTLEMK